MEKRNKEAKDNKNEIIFVFFDEINTYKSLVLLSKIICKHSYNRKKLENNILFIGVCNPYSTVKGKNKIYGLTRNKNDDNENLVYLVNQLPYSLIF